MIVIRIGIDMVRRFMYKLVWRMGERIASDDPPNDYDHA